MAYLIDTDILVDYIRGNLDAAAYLRNAEEPRTPEELAADYDLPLAAVREAIEYGKSNPPEVAADLAREEAIMAASGQLNPDYKYHPYPKILTPEDWARLLS